METLSCPNCKNLDSDKDIVVCDNDCGTVQCQSCLKDIYENKIGHNPSCGLDSDLESKSLDENLIVDK